VVDKENITIMLQLFDIPYLITTYGYLGIFIIVFLESGIFFALPGDSLLFTAGLLASVFSLDIWVLIPLIFVSTFLGGIVGYEIGLHLEKLSHYTFFRKILKQEHLDKTHKFFDKHGKFTVIFSRFVPIVRTFVPVVAGAVRMNYKLFIKYSLISSFLWSTTITLLGYFLGQIFPHIKNYLSYMVILIVIVSTLPIFYEMMQEKKS
jgi:membrane-associated protein